jgi:hypothetical protein
MFVIGNEILSGHDSTLKFTTKVNQDPVYVRQLWPTAKVNNDPIGVK